MEQESQNVELDEIPNVLPSARVDKLVDLSWENLGYEVEVDVEDGETGQKRKAWKPLLSGVTGKARGGRTLAIMGPSGAGKTTMLNAITGRLVIDETHKIHGCAFLNNTILTEKYKKCMAFVAQDDIVSQKETPREAFYFSYRIRTGQSDEEADRVVNEMLERLHLEECADTKLGVPGLITGGEKKRTNIGNELIVNPYILSLDEPTTGLDSVNASRIGHLLRELAYVENRTVLCTIHSPSSELFAIFDDILLLAKGHVIYHGPNLDAVAYFEKIGHKVPPHTNPCEHYMYVLQSEEAELERLWKLWEEHCLGQESDHNLSLMPVTMNLTSSDPILDAHAAGIKPSGILQLLLLFRRSLRSFLRDKLMAAGRAMQTTFFGILVGLFFWQLDKDDQGVQDRLGAIFMMSTNVFMISLMPSIMAFPHERALFLLEQSNDAYSSWIYVFGKIMAELPFQLLIPAWFILVAYFMVGYVGEFQPFIAFVLLAVGIGNCASALGLLTCSFFPAPEVAMAFVPIVIFPLMLVGGMMANTDRLEPWFLWLTNISVFRFAFKGMCIAEFSHIGQLCGAGAMCRFNNGDEVLKYLGFDGDKWGMQLLLMLAFTVVCYIGAACALAYQAKSVRGRLNFSVNISERAPSPKHMGVAASPTAFPHPRDTKQEK